MNRLETCSKVSTNKIRFVLVTVIVLEISSLEKISM